MADSVAVERPFNYKKTLIVGFGFLGISIIWPIFNQFIPIFLQAGNPAFEGGANVRGFGLGPALALFIMTWDNLINVFVQPWVGAKSDRTWNRIGRRKPWILLGVPIALVGFTLIPFAQTAVAIAAFILITNFGMALFRSPTVAWLGDLYEPEDRSKANGIINLMGGIGGLLAFFGGGALFEYFGGIDPELGRMAPFIGGGVLLVASAVVAVLGVREPAKITTEEEPDDPGVMANLQQKRPVCAARHPALVYGLQCPGSRAFIVCRLYPGYFPGHCLYLCRVHYDQLHFVCRSCRAVGDKIRPSPNYSRWANGADPAHARWILYHSGRCCVYCCFGAGWCLLGLRERQQLAAGL